MILTVILMIFLEVLRNSGAKTVLQNHSVITIISRNNFTQISPNPNLFQPQISTTFSSAHHG